jgi:hypothetical protein
MLTESLNSPENVVLQILKKDLGKRKLCARFVPHSLTPEQREDRVTSCQDIITITDTDKNFFNKIITGEETWCFTHDPEQNDNVLDGLVKHPLFQRNLNSRSPTSRPR